MRDPVLLVTNCLVLLLFAVIGYVAEADNAMLCRVLAGIGMSTVVVGSLIRSSRKPSTPAS